VPILISLLAGGSARVALAQGSVPTRYGDFTSIIVADSGEGRIVGQARRLSYPNLQRQAGVESAFIAVFAVDTTGHVELPTVSFVGTAPPAFRREVCRFLRDDTREPVARDGVKMRAFVVNPFSFTIEDGQLPYQPRLRGEPLREAIMTDGLLAAVRAFEDLPHC
jgi:hypothetical protein